MTSTIDTPVDNSAGDAADSDVLSEEEAAKEWASDGPLAIEVGPWGQASEVTCRMWENFDEASALRIYALLNAQQVERLRELRLEPSVED